MNTLVFTVTLKAPLATGIADRVIQIAELEAKVKRVLEGNRHFQDVEADYSHEIVDEE